MDRAVIEAKLRENRKRREKAQGDLTAARRELQKLLARGRKNGVDVAAMARAAGVSRDTAHRLIRTA
jgi:lambda repressor-like predicted transcriptional regulator